MTTLGNFGIDTENFRDDMLVRFADINNLKIINTFFDRKTSKEGTWKNLNGKTKDYIYFIFTNKLNTVKNAVVLNILNSSDL